MIFDLAFKSGATITVVSLLSIICVVIFTQKPPPIWMAVPLLFGMCTIAFGVIGLMWTIMP